MAAALHDFPSEVEKVRLEEKSKHNSGLAGELAACASNVRTLATQMQDEDRTRREAKTELQAGTETGDGSGQGGATGAED